MTKRMRVSTRRFSRDWVAEVSQNMKSIVQGKPGLTVRNAWMPKPPRWIQWLLASRLMFVNRVLGVQGCENINKFHHAVVNVSTPRGVRRAQFEADMRRKVETYLRRNAVDFISNWLVGIIDLVVVVGGVIAAAASVTVSLSSAVIGAALSVLIIPLIATSVNFLSTVFRRTVFYFSLVTVLFISVGSWAAVQIFSGSTFASARNDGVWRMALLFSLFGLGLVGVIGLLVSISTSRSQRRYYVRGGLDNYVLSSLLNVYHFITVHRRDWGQPGFQQGVGHELSVIANLMETYLPGRLAGIGVSGRRERKVFATESGQAIRLHMKDLLRNDGRDRLRQMVNSYVSLIYRGAWLEVPREVVAARAHGLMAVIRPLGASILPAVVMLCLREAKVVAGNYETYGWLFASLWFVVSIGTWIDPGLAERLKVMNTMISLFKGQDETSEIKKSLGTELVAG